MITIVYCWVCILFAACQCQSLLDIEGYSNDSPYVGEPKRENRRVNVGTRLNLHCNHTTVTWEFRPCQSNYKGLQCDNKIMDKIDNKRSSWVKLGVARGRLQIESANKNHSGLYRCSDKEVVQKLITLEVVSPDYEGPPPDVAPLNISNQLNMEFIIQCNVTSIIPPTIIWFRNCYDQKCDIKYDNICYCHINRTISVYNVGNTYLSKHLISNARDDDTGLYACLAVTEYGKDYKNVFIKVPSSKVKGENESFSLLFLIPFTLILVPVAVWHCYYRKKKKSVAVIVDQQKQLIKPVVRINTELNQIV